MSVLQILRPMNLYLLWYERASGYSPLGMGKALGMGTCMGMGCKQARGNHEHL